MNQLKDKGTIKYLCHWNPSGPLDPEEIDEINAWRGRLYRLGLIGAYENGIGYGNLSIRKGQSDAFIITGSGTGRLRSLDETHYTRVTSVDFEANSLTCRGPVRASSESLTHAAVYVSHRATGGVIHIHHMGLWKNLMDCVPTTSPKAGYGTPEMAFEVMRLLRESNFRGKNVLVMGGHEEGLIAFGKGISEAGGLLLKLYGDLGAGG
ncbi:MAG: class II aldolase/adducin family protein [Desulfatiglandales bacterium]